MQDSNIVLSTLLLIITFIYIKHCNFHSKLSVTKNKKMHLTKQPSLPKRNSGRIIVDEYEQMKRQREEEGVCPFCRNQIPLRLMTSHRNVCAFGVSFQSLEEDEDGGRRSEEKMGCSTYTQKNVRNGHEQTPSKLASQRHRTRPNYSALSNKKMANKKVINLENGSVRNLSRNKNQKESSRKLSSAKNKPQTASKLFDNNIKKNIHVEKFQKKEPVNKSMVSQQYKQYFGSLHKKKGVSKMKKNVKNLWVEQSNKKKNQFKETQIKRQKGKQLREEKLRKLQNQTQKLKRQQQQLVRQLQRQKKNQRRHNTRNASQRKEQKREPRRQPQPQPRIPSRPRQPQARANPTRNQNNPRNPRRYPTAEQSYYEQIPINHPHRTINFISQTINQQFEMMKEQFEHMNEFFSNFVPFSNNGFVYFERNQDEDYSIDSSVQSVGYDAEQQEQGLFEQQIQLLPRYPYIKKLGGDDQCAICIGSIKHQELVRRLPCHHIFHSECIDEWLRRKAACPVCRDRMSDLGQ